MAAHKTHHSTYDEGDGGDDNLIPTHHQIQQRDETLAREEGNFSLQENLVHTFVPTGLKLATISNLESGMEYQITVASRNQFGESRAASEPVKAKTAVVPVGILSRSNPASASASGHNRGDGGLNSINISIIITSSTLALVCLVLFSALLVYYRRKSIMEMGHNADSSAESSATGSGSSHSGGHHQHADQYVRTSASSTGSGSIPDPPYMINANSVAPSCKCEPLPMLSMSLSKHDGQINCDTKCYLQGKP